MQESEQSIAIDQVDLSKITERIRVRRIKQKGVELLKRKIEEVGYLPEHPLLLASKDDGNYILIGGNHRYEALLELGITSVPALIDNTISGELALLQRARRTNETSETVIPTTFVDDAEFIWQELVKTGMTQDRVATILGWSREKVKNYAALQRICVKAWEIIGTTIENAVPIYENGSVPNIGTLVPFSEGLLRAVLTLSSDQQLELISDLANNKINKKQFSSKAATYKARNAVKAYVIQQLASVAEDFIRVRLADVDRGGYDADWETTEKEKTSKLIESIKAEWEQKSGTRLCLGDFAVEVLEVDDGIVDLILTDPPYNISNQGKVTKRGGELVNASFGGDERWDSEEPEHFIFNLKDWASQWFRIIRPGGSVIVFCDRILISDLWRIFEEVGLIPKSVIIWVKDNPNPAGLSRKALISATEFMLWAVKPGEGHTFNESTTWDRRNVLTAPLCAGSERLTDGSGNTLHPTQKPLAVLNPLVEVFSNRGDLVFDGFAGVGSSGAAAVSQGRKFIGIEKSTLYFEAMQMRLNSL